MMLLSFRNQQGVVNREPAQSQEDNAPCASKIRSYRIVLHWEREFPHFKFTMQMKS